MPIKRSHKKSQSQSQSKRLSKPKYLKIRSHKEVRLPKTRKVLSHKSKPRIFPSHANSNMSLTDLQFMAKTKGIPFGGLKKSQLIHKINML